MERRKRACINGFSNSQKITKHGFYFSSPVTRTMSSVHNATEHSYVKEQSKGCSFTMRLRFLAAYPEQSTYSSADFLKRLVNWYARRGIRVECVQTDNGFEFTNRFPNSKRDIQALFEKTAAELGIQHKLIRPYTPRHNGKVERSHREDKKRFYSLHAFFSLADFEKQLSVHNRRSNNLPMRPLNWLSPNDFLVQHL